MALDIGRKRTGLAVSDSSATMSTPLKVLRSQEVIDNASTFRKVLEDYEVEKLVIGIPISLDGRENDHAKWVRQVAEKISKATSLPVEFQDERLSSAQAKRIMREQGMTEKEMRGKLDMVAASVFLQTYLDSIK